MSDKLVVLVICSDAAARAHLPPRSLPLLLECELRRTADALLATDLLVTFEWAICWEILASNPRYSELKEL